MSTKGRQGEARGGKGLNFEFSHHGCHGGGGVGHELLSRQRVTCQVTLRRLLQSFPAFMHRHIYQTSLQVIWPNPCLWPAVTTVVRAIVKKPHAPVSYGRTHPQRPHTSVRIPISKHFLVILLEIVVAAVLLLLLRLFMVIVMPSAGRRPVVVLIFRSPRTPAARRILPTPAATATYSSSTYSSPHPTVSLTSGPQTLLPGLAV